jgi:pyridoxal 5'-phosphate synthase pdxT subunit
MKKPTIGVLALQGAFREHLQMLDRIGARGIAIKYPAELHLCEGLIIPGGESTTMGKLMAEYGFLEELRGLIGKGMPVFGTCAGLIVLAKRLGNGDQPLLGLMDITVERNAFGRQVDSFETDLVLEDIERPGESFRAVFIRAPQIEETGAEVRVLGQLGGKTVVAREENMLVCAFHPELTRDDRLHHYFLKMVRENYSVSAERE